MFPVLSLKSENILTPNFLYYLFCFFSSLEVFLNYLFPIFLKVTVVWFGMVYLSSIELDRKWTISF